MLRLGHRQNRDKRVSSHVALTARAFGAKGIFFDVADERLFKSIEDVVERWGGDFFVKHVSSWRKLVREFDGLRVHLTMYGIPLPKKIGEMRKARKILVIVGSEKVPADVFELADLNISIGNQPHSEVSALAVFLDRVLDGEVFSLKFENAKIKILPSERGKRVVELDREVG